MAQFMAIPQASNEVVEVAVANGLKTLLQVKPVTKDLLVCGWGIASDGSAAGAGIQVELIDVDVAATVTSLTPIVWWNEDGAAALAVGGTSATGYNASAEGSITASRVLDATELRPDTDRYAMWLPQPAKVAAGRFLRVRCRYTTTAPNCIPWICFDEV